MPTIHQSLAGAHPAERAQPPASPAMGPVPAAAFDSAWVALCFQLADRFGEQATHVLRPEPRARLAAAAIRELLERLPATDRAELGKQLIAELAPAEQLAIVKQLAAKLVRGD